MWRWVIGGGAILWFVGAVLGWFTGSFDDALSPHELVGITNWVYLFAVPLLAAPFAPSRRWLTIGAWIAGFVFVVTALMLLLRENVEPQWPYVGSVTGTRFGLVLSTVGSAACFLGLLRERKVMAWRRVQRSERLRIAAIVSAGVVVVAAIALRADLAGEKLERYFEGAVAREEEDEKSIDVRCNTDDPPKAECSWRVKYRKGGQKLAAGSPTFEEIPSGSR